MKDTENADPTTSKPALLLPEEADATQDQLQGWIDDHY